MINWNNKAFEELQDIGRLLLLKAYKEMGIFIVKGERYFQQDIIKKAGIIPLYTQLNEALLRILTEAEFIHIDGDVFVSAEKVEKAELDGLKEKKDLIAQKYPVIGSHMKLLWECLVNYRDILRGDVPATQVMFPESSMELVEGTYKGNEICDVFNRRVASSIRIYLEAKLSKPVDGEMINILEIGAGTGGTSAFVLKEIKPYEKHINYVYTDISQAFTLHGEKTYFTDYPFMQFKVMDIEKDVVSQGIEPNKFDIVLGANVIHATKDISNTLMNVKMLLKENGWFILNELTQRWEFATLTFGLLDGWWLSQDKNTRIKWSPLLSEEMWKNSLETAGFKNVVALGEEKNDSSNFSQHVIIAESDGVVSSENTVANAVKASDTESNNDYGVFKEDYDISNESLKEFASSRITGIIADILHIKKNKINAQVPLWDYGVDSILIGLIVSKVNKELGVSIKSSDLFSYSTILKLAEHLASNALSALKKTYLSYFMADFDNNPRKQDKEKSDKEQVKAVTPDKNITTISGSKDRDRMFEDIAVIGIAGRFPKAENVGEFWNNLKKGIDCISEIPPDRWNMDGFYHPEKGVPGKSYCKYGGFISDADKFDSLFFNLSPKQAELMDPRQRLFLQETWRVIEDAGYSRKSVENKKLGVFLGSEGETEYLADKFDEPEEYSSHLFLGNSNSIMSARLSYFMDLKGPCVTIDTACSSSLVAVHTACESIRTGNCDMAIAGGAQIMISPRSYILLSKMGMLSPDGKCKTFDNSANGFVPGEAVAAVLLKPLSAAIKDKDYIYCVIKGSATNQDGKSNGITAPNVLAQEQLESEVYNKSGISPETITYIEAHGTGTKLGDPVEVEGLTKAFSRFTSNKQYCSIGSVKSNIGHAGAAAGISALIKVALALKNKQVPPSINFSEANEQIDFKNTPFYVNTELTDWNTKSGFPRRAGVSSFGHSGTNCHIILEEAPAFDTVEKCQVAPYHIVAVSAESSDSQKRKLEDMRSWLKELDNNISISDISYTSLVGRTHMTLRSAFVVSSVKELISSLEVLMGGGMPENYISCPNQEDCASTTVSSSEFEAIVSELNTNTSEAAYVKRLFEIVGFYVDGADYAWEKLFSNKGCRRVPMPAYPFQKNRYWILDNNNKFEKAAVLHPLLGTNTSTLREQSFKTTFDGSEFYFNEHIVKGQKVLPGVAHIEMARAAGELAGERRVCKIRNIVWARPIICDKKQLDTVINLYPAKDYVDYRICTLNENGNKEVNSQGRIFYQSGEDKEKEVIDIDKIKSRCSLSISGDESYQRFAGFGMSLGTGFRVTDRIWIGKSEVISLIRLPESQKHSFSSYGLHPSIMDGTLQAMIGLLDGEEKRLCIPYAMGEIEIFSEPGDECYSFIRLSDDQTGVDTDVRKFDVKVLNKNGEVIINIKEVLARPVKWEGQECEITYVKNVWQQKPLLVSDKGKEELTSGAVLIISEDSAGIDSIESILPNAGKGNQNVVLAVKGDSFENGATDIYRINPLRMDDFQKMFSELKLRGITPNKILYIANEIRLNGTEGTQGIWKDSYFSIFNLVKSLIKHDPTQDIQIVYAFKTDAKMPLNAAVSGFAAAVKKENPGININTVELENGSNNLIKELGILLNEVCECSGNHRDDVLYKSGIRYVKKYKQVNLEKDKHKPTQIKRGGVYLITGGAGGLGSIFAEHLAKQERVKLVLSGRSDKNQKIDRILDSIQRLGSEAIYIKGDISKREEASYILSETRKHFGMVNGIIHSAGAVRDAGILKKSDEDLCTVIGPKVDGLIFLDELTADHPLDFFVTFSSISSILGNAGQCDYSYANSFMNNFVLNREKQRSEGQRKDKTVSIAWPLWIDGGMNVDKAVKELINTTMGIKGLDTETGLEIFDYVLEHESGFIAAFEGNREKILYNLDRDVADKNALNIEEAIPSGTADEKNDKKLVTAFIKKSVSEVMNIKEQDINTGKNLSGYGFDSISFTDLSNSINKSLGLELTPALFFQYPCVDSIVDYLVKNFMKDILKVVEPRATQKNAAIINNAETVQQDYYPETRFIGSIEPKEEPGTVKDSYEEPIAVIGMSGVFPKSGDLDAFWKHLNDGDNLISEIPAGRWDWKAYFGDPKKEPNKTNVKWGGFIDTIDKFDASYFRISPREARLMDPQQRIAMEMVWKAIEDSGYRPSDLAGTDTALFVGVSAIDYSELTKEYGVQPEAYTSTGIAHSVLVNRISFLLDIHGPSEPVDTACSSSLVAIHRGIEALRSGRSNIAIAGGVNVLLSPSVYIAFSKAGMLCEDGKCKTFDKDANGYVRGEGAGIIVLKPLSKAKADGDHIYAVIKGSAQNHGGKANSLTAPNPNAQAEVIKSALKNAKVDPSTISYVEAHGSGTSLGDPIEVNGLIKAFSEMKAEGELVTSKPYSYCGIGSVKTNAGHLEAAAGIAGIIKVILAMKNKKIPASINFNELNPYIKIDGSPFYIADKTRTWDTIKDENGMEIPRRAGVSSFGFGGANAHIVIEEYPENLKIESEKDNENNVIVLSAKNSERLKEYAANLVDFLEKQANCVRKTSRSSNISTEKVIKALVESIEAVTNVPAKDIDIEEDLEEYGFDSVLSIELLKRLEIEFNTEFNFNEISLYASIREIGNRLSDSLAMAAGETADAQDVMQGELSFDDLAYTLQIGREAHEERVALVSSGIEDVIQKLKMYCLGKAPVDGLYIGNKSSENMSTDLLIDGAEGQEFLKLIISGRKYDKIAKLWASGADIDWKLMSYAGEHRRISLPTYPFARDSYWISKATTNRQAVDVAEKGQPIMYSNKKMYTERISVEEPVVRDHTIYGKPVLPGVGHIELACKAFKELYGISEFGISRVVWLVPFVMESDDKEIIVAFEEKQGGFTYEIQSKSGESTIIHSRGMITPHSRNSKVTDNRIFNINDIEKSCTDWIQKEDFYSQFRKTCVNHGPYFQGLCKLGWNSEEAIAKVLMPEEFENELKQSVLHPTIMDCSLQGIAGIAVNLFRKDGQPMLPFAIENIEIMKPFGKTAFSYVKKSGSDRFNVLILNENGEVCASLKDVVLRELKDQLQGYLFMPSWKHVPAPRLNQGKKNSDKGAKVIMVYNHSEENFALELSNQIGNDDTVFVELSSETKKLDKEKWNINYKQEGDFAKLLKEIGQVKTIYFLGGINFADAEKEELSVLDEVQERGVICFFKLIKALNNNGYDQTDIAIKVVTNNLRKIHPDDVIAPLSACLTGFTMSVAKEYPGWEVSVIDIDAREIRDKRLAELVVDEEGCVGGKEIAIRNSRRFEMSIDPVWLPPVNTPTFKKDGVYVIVGGAGGIGMVFADYLSGTIGAKVVLIGRSELDDDRRNKIDEMCTRGGEVLYIKADMTSPEMMEKAFAKIKSYFGKINAVIHSAIVLKDRTIETMSEKDLKDVLAPKVLGTAVLHKLLKKENLDFMMFFSSSQSFTASLGQSNYAAACTFKDVYANYIAEKGNYPVHLVNWGFWGTVGVVASEEYNRRLAAKGVGSISPEEGIETVKRIISHDIRQVITLKANPNLLKSIGINMEKQTQIYAELSSPLLTKLTNSFIEVNTYPEAVKISDKAFEYVEDYGRRMLLKAFKKMGVFLSNAEKYNIDDLKKRLGIIPIYERLYLELLNSLAEVGFVRIKGKTVTAGSMLGKKAFEEELELLERRGKTLVEEYPGIKSHITLLTKCIEKYPEILRGETKATEIIFPGSSMELVESIYKGNETVDYYNSIVSGCIKEYLRNRLTTGERTEKIKILEVGAGTGGTSDSVLKAINCYKDDIKYYYTDISPAFINHGKKQYGKANPFVEFKLLGIDKNLLEQGFVPGDFDIVLATNVLHATRRIDGTLKNIKRLVKKNGWVVINETTRKLLFTTLTFGLLEGWWLFEDKENRIDGGPVLSPAMWKTLLNEEGFMNVAILGERDGDDELKSRQNVIIGESNGVVSYKSDVKDTDYSEVNSVNQVKVKDTINSYDEVAAASVPYIRADENLSTDIIMSYVQETVINCAADTLGVSEDSINLKKQFYEYGMDSISTMELTNKLNESLRIAIRTTALFDYGNVKDLTEYIVREFGNQIAIDSAADHVKSPSQVGDRINIQVSGTKVINHSPGNTSEIKRTIEKRITDCVSAVIDESAENIDSSRPFFEYGVDSIAAMDLINLLNRVFEINLRSTAVFDFGNVKELAGYIADNYSDKLSLTGNDLEGGNTAKDFKDLSEDDAIRLVFEKLARGEVSADEADKMMEVIYE